MEHGLKLKPSKCNFFRTEISYLGHKVSAAGMEPGTDSLKGIAEISPPVTYTQVRKFLGATGYFRRFIKGYARIAKPLNDLLQGENSKLKSHPVGLPLEALAVFQELKIKCLTAPLLAFMDFKKPFLLETDALIEGLGAVLSQKQDDGRYHPITYASRSLKGGELKYHSSKLEFLALKWAVTEQFREYLQYQPFLVRTDNNPLTYVMTMPNLNIGWWQRWPDTILRSSTYVGWITRSLTPSAAWAGDWMKRPSRSYSTRVPLKNCSITPCVTASLELRLMTLEWCRSMRRPRERSSYRHECWRKPKETIRTYVTHSG